MAKKTKFKPNILYQDINIATLVLLAIVVAVLSLGVVKLDENQDDLTRNDALLQAQIDDLKSQHE